MSNSSDQGIWFVDEESVATQLNIETDPQHPTKREVTHPAVYDALHGHLAGDSERALSTLRAAIVAGNADALVIAGQIAFESGRFEDAAKHYKRLSEVQPDHPNASLNAGICLVRLRRWRMAIEALQRAVVLDSDRYQSWYVLGVCLLNERRGAEARASFARSLRLAEHYVPAWFGQAAALQLEGKHEEALAIYDRLLAALPEEEGRRKKELLENALYAAWRRGDRIRLKSYATRLMEPTSEGPSASVHGAWAQLVLAVEDGKFDEAVNFAAALAHGHPSSSIDWFNYGVCLRLAGGLQEAALAFENSLRLNPTDPGAWREQGAALWACGQNEKAAGAYEEALARDSADHQSRRALVMLALERGELERVSELRNGLHDPHGEIAFGLAVISHRRKEFEQASELYMEALSRQPEWAECRWNLAHALYALEKRPEANIHWRRALELKPELALSAMN